ncbi:MAG: hypothetical protein K6U02_00260 [Firmicutes bacterium]|nr:hypothetical protein [Bacillota bacterium]
MARERIVRFVLLSATLAALLLFFWPKSSPHGLPAILEATPAGADQVIFLNVAQLRNSGLLQRLLSLSENPANPTAFRPDPEYLEFVRSTGFDYTRDLDSVLIVRNATAQPADPAGHVGVGSAPLILAEGRFNRSRIRRHALQSGRAVRAGPWEIVLVPSAAAHHPNAPAPNDTENISFAFLEPNRVALTRGERLEEWLRRKPLRETDPELFGHVRRLAGSAVFLLANVPPRSVLAAAGMDSPAWQRLQESIRWYALALVLEPREALLFADLTCNTASEASALAELLEGLRDLAVAALAAPDPPQGLTRQDAERIRRMLLQVHLTPQDTTVRLRTSLDLAWLAEPDSTTR